MKWSSREKIWEEREIKILRGGIFTIYHTRITHIKEKAHLDFYINIRDMIRKIYERKIIRVHISHTKRSYIYIMPI